MTGLRKRTNRAGLSLCAAATTTAATAVAVLALLTIPGFTFIHHVDCVPVKMVVDFPTFAATLLGSLSHEPVQQDQTLVTSPSSSSYLTKDQSDDDPDYPHLTKAELATSSRYSHSSSASILADYELDLHENLSNSSLSQQISNSTAVKDDESTTTALVADLASQNSSTSDEESGTIVSTEGSSSPTLTLIGGTSKKAPHIIRLPNGQSFQFCDELMDLSCRDENAVCKMGGCVCKPGFFLHRQSGLCQSISDLLKNCENDYQCQAFDVDLVCDSKSHERSFCDCAEGLYFDQETYSCIPCHRNTFVLATNNKELLKKLNQTQTPEISASNSSLSTDTNGTATTVQPPIQSSSPVLRPCKPIDLAKFNFRRRKQQHQVPYDQPSRGSSSLSTGGTSSTSSTNYHPASSDPFRIKTPLEVFMGAIMLFTLLTVAWFFLQRMFHDCRVILRSLRNPDFTGHCPDGATGTASHLASIAPNSRPDSQLYLDPAGQAVARLLSNDSYNSSLAGIYQRDLAGVMVQHLAANLSPSSTSHALAAATNGSIPRGDNEINIYPLTISSQQSRSAAAAAAAQLLLPPSHPAIAILRAAAASVNQNTHSDYNQTSLLNSMLDPPPKYEEAIAQSEATQPSSYISHQRNNQTSSRASDDNDDTRDEELDEGADEIGDEVQTTSTRSPGTDETNNQPSENNDDPVDVAAATRADNSQPPTYHSVADASTISRPGSSTTSSSGGPSESDQTNSRRPSSTRRKMTRRSRRGRGSTKNRQTQQQNQSQTNQDSDDTLTESH